MISELSRPPWHRSSAMAAVALALAVLSAILVRTSNGVAAVAVLVGVSALGVAIGLARVVRSREAEWINRQVISRDQRFATAALFLFLASTLVFRNRTSSSIAENPLDTAGVLRVLFLGSSAALSVMAWPGRKLGPTQLPVAFRAYAVQIGIGFVGVATAVAPGFVLFKLATSVVMMMAIYVCVRRFPSRPYIVIDIALGWAKALLAVSLLGIVLFRSEALMPVPAALPFRLRGVVPNLSPNDLGLVSAIVLVCTIFRSGSKWWIPASLTAFVLTQYRTAYVAVVVVAVAYLALRYRATGRTMALVLAAAMAFAAQTQAVQELWQRDTPSAALANANGRLTWWSAGLEALERSPIFGLGVGSGTRFEVFVSSNLDREGASQIHSVWIETLVGTGYLGFAALVVSVVAALAVATRHSFQGGSSLPLMILVLLLVRSFTGDAFEFASLWAVFFLGAPIACTSRLSSDEHAGVGAVGRPAAMFDLGSR